MIELQENNNNDALRQPSVAETFKQVSTGGPASVNAQTIVVSAAQLPAAFLSRTRSLGDSRMDNSQVSFGEGAAAFGKQLPTGDDDGVTRSMSGPEEALRGR